MSPSPLVVTAGLPSTKTAASGAALSISVSRVASSHSANSPAFLYRITVIPSTASSKGANTLVSITVVRGLLVIRLQLPVRRWLTRLIILRTDAIDRGLIRRGLRSLRG